MNEVILFLNKKRKKKMKRKKAYENFKKFPHGFQKKHSKKRKKKNIQFF